MIQYIFGISTGRSGTGTLAKLLDKQKGISCSHEGQFIPWDRDIIAFYQSLIGMTQKEEVDTIRVGNVAFYWKNYLPEIFRDLLDPKVIVLKRAKEKVVESFSSMYRDKNHWSTPGGRNWDGRDPQDVPLTLMFPKYDLSKKDAIGQYWEEYYNDGAIDYYLDKFPQNIMVIRSEDLWAGKDAQKRIFEFLDIPEADMVFDTSIWMHKRPKEKPKFLAINRAAPSELKQIGLNKALYGINAMAIVGMPMDVEVELTDEEMAQIKDDPEIMKALNKEEELNAQPNR